MPQLNPQAGLGAMMQPQQTPHGMPASSMSQIMHTAKQMTDSQLADVMAGKSMDVPQYVAMTEAMGRQQLRTAMQGATAMATAKQPTEKEKLLLTMQQPPQASLAQDPKIAAAIQAQQAQQQPQQQPAAGLAAAPAPNMESLGHAGGGIIAFADRGAVQDNGGVEDIVPADVAAATRAAGESNGAGLWDMLKKSFGQAANQSQDAYVRSLLVPGATYQGQSALPAPSSSPLLEDESKRGAVTPEQAAAASAVPGSGTYAPPTNQPPAAGLNAAAAATKPGGGGGFGGAGASGSWEDLYKKTAERFKKENPLPQHPDRFEGMDQTKEDVAKQIASNKDQGLGAFMMQLGGKLLSTPGFGRAMGAGVEAGMPGVEATRKENLMLTKDQRDYQFNLAKAREAADQGKDELSLKYAHAAEDIASKVGMLAVQDKTADAHVLMARAAMQRGSGSSMQLSDKAQKEVGAASLKLYTDWAKQPMNQLELKKNPALAAMKQEEFYKQALSVHPEAQKYMQGGAGLQSGLFGGTGGLNVLPQAPGGAATLQLPGT